MSSGKLYLFVVCLILLNSQIDWSNASFLDYIWPSKKGDYYNSDMQALPSVPFELAEGGDKFILSGAKLLGNKLSELDFCQQRVILQVKSSCKSLNEEKLGKLAVALMNCQLQNEGRETCECSDSMSLKDCTSSMPADVLNLYRKFFSESKAMCLTIRQDHFRIIAELTVNNLMDATNDHLQRMQELKTNHKQLEQAALTAIDDITDKNLKLLEMQQELLRISESQKKTSEMNLVEIIKEKNLLKTVQEDLGRFLSDAKNKIDVGLSEIEEHSTDIKDVHIKLIKDFANLQDIAKKVLDSLEKTHEHISEEHLKNTNYIEETIEQLKEANDIVRGMSYTLMDIRKNVEEPLTWLIENLGEKYVNALPVTICHILYLSIGMLCLLFINSDILSRLIFLAAVSLNLSAVLYGFIKMDLVVLTETIMVLLIGNALIKLSKKYNWNRFFCVEMEAVDEESSSLQNGYVRKSNLNIRTDAINKNARRPKEEETSSGGYFDRNSNLHVRKTLTSDHKSSTSIHQNEQTNEDSSDRSRSTTPFNSTSYISGYNRCKALTVRGTQCQLTSLTSHGDYCRIHERSSTERFSTERFPTE